MDDEEADEIISNYNDKDDEKLSNCSTNTTKEDVEDTSSDRQQSSSVSGDGSSSVQLTSQQLLKSAVSKSAILNNKFGGFYEVKNFRSGSVSDITSSASSSSSSRVYHDRKSSTNSDDNNGIDVDNADAADSDNTSADNNRCNADNNFEVKSDGSDPVVVPNTESYHHGIDVPTSSGSYSRNQSTEQSIEQ